MAKKYDEGIDPTSPSIDTTNRHAVDALLRKHGFRIHTRSKRVLEPLWSKDGVIFPQAEAIYRLPSQELADAVYLEDLYLSGFKL